MQYCIMILTMKKASNPSCKQLEMLAFYGFYWARSLRVEQPTVNRLHASSTLVAPARLISPTDSANYLWGLTSGLLQRQGLLDPLSFWPRFPKKSKAKVDLSQ